VRIFLVDYENVNSLGLNGIDKLKRTDKIVLFYSDSASTISFAVHDMIIQKQIRMEKYKLNQSDKNALDFQLVTYLGYWVANHQNKENEIFIISKDKGYLSAIEFCSQVLKKTVVLKPSIAIAIGTDVEEHITEEDIAEAQRLGIAEDEYENIMSELIINIPKSECREIISNIVEFIHTTDDRIRFNNAIVKEYGTEKAKIYYNAFKQYYDKIKEY
jgi:hypothetical protein